MNGLSCSLSPAHRMIKKKQFALETSVDIIFTDPDNWSPLVPNINLGIKYGITHSFNVGGIVSVFTPFVDGIILVEPYVVYNVITEKKRHPGFRIYCIFPTVVSCPKREAQLYPTLGFYTNYKYKQFQYALGSEFLLNAYNKTKDKVRYDIFTGIDYYTRKNNSIALEFGIDDIGQKNKIHGWTFGRPVLKIGYFYNLKKRDKNE